MREAFWLHVRVLILGAGPTQIDWLRLRPLRRRRLPRGFRHDFNL